MPCLSRRRSAATLIAILLPLSLLNSQPRGSAASDKEYVGTFQPELVAHAEDMDQVTFRPVRDLSRIKLAKPIEEGSKVTAGRLYHPPSDKSSILTLLVEPEDGPALPLRRSKPGWRFVG
jgi:hypothetical protein